MRSSHAVWLAAHPYVDAEWLRGKVKEGFHVHHLDGDRRNDTADNLLLIFGPDHSRLHRLERRIKKMEHALNLDFELEAECRITTQH